MIDPDYKTDEVAGMPYPERIVSDANRAVVVCEGGYLAHAKYHYSIFNMIEQFDGLLPHNPAELEETGISWASNVPYRAGWAQIETATTNRLNMLKSALYFAKLCFRPHEKSDEDKPEYFFLFNPSLRSSYESRFTKIFIDTLVRDPKFIRKFLLKLAYNEVTWGYAVSQCEEHCVLPTIALITDVYFERATTLEAIKIYIQVFYNRAQDVYTLYKKEESRGWDNSFYIKEGLEEALIWAIERIDTKSYTSWADIVRSYDAQALYDRLGQFTDTMSWAWIWNEEVGGGVTKTMWLWNRGLLSKTGVPNIFQGSQMPNGSELSYQRHWKDLKLADVWRLYENTGVTNTDIAQDLRGLAPYAYEFDIQNNILRNSANDALVMALPLKLQPQFGAQTDAVNQINVMAGVMTLPPNTPIVREDGSGRNLQFAMEFMALNKSEYSQSTSQFNSQVSNRLTDRATNQQVQAVTAEVTRERSDFATVPTDSLGKELKSILHRCKEEYAESDPGYDTRHYLYQRVCNELYPLTGQDQLDEPQFSEEEFYRALIEAVDYVALEYATSDVVSLQTLIQLAQTPEGKLNFIRKLALANGASYDEINAYWPWPDSPDLNVNDSSLALIENFMFWDTGEVEYNALQNPGTHLEIHFAKASQVLATLKEGRDPMTVWNWLANMLPHAQKHLEQLSTDPYQVQLFEQMQATFKQLIQITDGVGKFAQQQAAQIAQQQGEQQAQQGNQIPPEVAAKIQILQIQTQEKKQRSDQLYAQKTAQSQEKFQQQMQMKQESHDQQMKINAQNAALQLEIAKQNASTN